MDSPTWSDAAVLQAGLWGERADDWADVMEGSAGWGAQLYRQILQRLAVDRGTDLLDVGCGAGRFCRIAADRGAICAGIDVTERFVKIARTRTPDGDFRVGDMEHLPWTDNSFDVVTGFNSFFIAADMGKALSEARRVARPGATVAMTVFGRPERCESTALFASLQPFMPQRSGSGSKDEKPPLHAEGVLEAIATEAGLTPSDAGYLEFTEEYPDRDTMLRGYMAAPPFVRAARAAGAEAVTDALSDAMIPLRARDGRYRLRDEVRYLIATA